jgi:nicotinamide-nucleotide amidase
MDRSTTLDAPDLARSRRTPRRRILTAELLAIGSELTTGETRDSNANDLARSLTERGVRVDRIVELPDDRAAVADAFRDGLTRVDLVAATGGLGPTPDDLTREAIGDAIGEEPTVDPELEAWVRAFWTRRRMPFPESNLKQAWLLPSATAIRNGHGTAPGWWVDRPDGRVIVAMPGPPREMHPMWEAEVVPRLAARGLGRPTVIRTLRLAGIGESQAAERIGRPLLEGAEPNVATFARPDGVDVRVIAAADDDDSARASADSAVRQIRAAVGDHVWAEGATTWPEAIESALAERGLRLMTLEHGTRGSLAALLGAVPRLVAAPHDGSLEPAAPPSTDGPDVIVLRLSVEPAPAGGDLEATIDVAGPGFHVSERALAFLRDDQGRDRAAILAAWALLRALRDGR